MHSAGQVHPSTPAVCNSSMLSSADAEAWQLCTRVTGQAKLVVLQTCPLSRGDCHIMSLARRSSHTSVRSALGFWLTATSSRGQVYCMEARDGGCVAGRALSQACIHSHLCLSSVFLWTWTDLKPSPEQLSCCSRPCFLPLSFCPSFSLCPCSCGLAVLSHTSP